MVAEWSKALSQIQVEKMPKVPGSNPRPDIDRSETEMSCRSSNSRAPGGSCAAYNIELSVDAMVPKSWC